MKHLIFLLFLAATTLPLFAQRITETQYFDKNDDSTRKENAVTYSLTTYTDSSKKVYTVKKYSIKGQLQSDFSFRTYGVQVKYDGNYIVYHDNGHLKIKGAYIRDRLQGELTSWYANGQIKRKDEYVMDSLIRGHCYTATGKDTTWFPFDVGFTYGNGLQELFQFFGKNIHYPINSLKLGIQGDVHILFTIEKNGTVSHEQVRKSVNEEIDAEALRIFRVLPPNWKPTLKDGEPQRQQAILPVSFRVEG
ncbi:MULTISPECIES: energy transducer TonB [Niastella]|uniref:TonB family protein n=1 Tax=Niastella soli TaxID=2821487 RepID=A0ABS3YVY2_9BACT|nr:energy transducer TonB [Niastella soli]MBO9202043.1 TonB family protein [Niastella soli]